MVDYVGIAAIGPWLVEQPYTGWSGRIVGRCAGNSGADLLDIGGVTGATVHIHGIDPGVPNPGELGLICIALADKTHIGKSLIAQTGLNLGIAHAGVLEKPARSRRMHIGKYSEATPVLAKIQLDTKRRSAGRPGKYQSGNQCSSRQSGLFAQADVPVAVGWVRFSELSF